MQVITDKYIIRIYKMENVKKIKFVVVVYGLLWLSFCIEIKIHDE